ncbi:peptidylprolyl isomerase [Bowmanella denitrificans]|uniref:peptidylprolyl isomerase n=1 Tax=Bowmanella denitrificans TaxID=366582 RepID=A0ABP3H7X4_9ALTE
MKGWIVSLIVALATCAVQAEQGWRTPDPQNLIYLQLEQGQVVMELAPFMAPEHVRQFKRLVREGYYDGLDFYRVVDGFVAQGGDVSETRLSEHKQNLQAEFSRAIKPDANFTLVQEPDFFADQTGYLQGFAAARDVTDGQEWLVHCPGVLAMARSTEANSGSADFYIVIGQAPRHLDRNMSVFGRVLWGMPHLQALPRGNPDVDMGVIAADQPKGKILSMQVAADIPVEKHLPLQVQEQDSAAMAERLDRGRKMDNAFFHFKGNGKLDICYYPTKVRLATKG